ncbi:uncharacterized protein LOC129752177 [Uranotaenia lowii]|uniref:uncharacterized protein LOC129752177 n=1 Tax=Uranotaenia lowii TaxID=190385 RepID=UPI00247A1215|nr:uncharacterized protein LOC129752177 [Uranotaenia lowii]
MKKQLLLLMDRRDRIVRKLLRVQDSIENEAEPNIHRLNLHLETVRRCYDDFESTHEAIFGQVSAEEKDDVESEYANFENLHDGLYVRLQTMIADMKNAPVMNSAALEFQPKPQPINPIAHLQVPLPTFDGKLENWFSFKCMFQTIMNRYPNESPAIKLHHLKNSLIGGAAGKIDQDVINNNDYESAWRLLEDAYEDERLIIDTHIDALLELPKLSKENGDELRKLVEALSKNVDALKNRNLPVEGLSEMMLINVVGKCMDRETRKLWESSMKSGTLPSYQQLVEFLKERSRVLQKLQGQTQQPTNTSASRSKQAKVFVQSTSETCPCCKGESIYKCLSFKKLSAKERFERVKKAGLCFNCLRKGHRTAQCKTDQCCKSCGKPHHTLLHLSETTTTQFENSPNPSTSTHQHNKKQDGTADTQIVNCCTQTQATAEQIFLSTALVLVAGAGNRKIKCRALLDCCSEANLITENLAAKLNITPTDLNPPITICGLNGMKTMSCKTVRTNVSSRNRAYSASLDFLITPSITELPTGKVDINSWNFPRDFELADPSFNVPREVDMIIGAEVFYDVLKKGRMKIGSNLPTLAETVFGWVVSGSAKTTNKRSSQRVCQVNTTHDDVNRTLMKFWELENCCNSSTMTAVERAVEKHFEETHRRSSDGRFIVRMPFNDLRSQLGDSFETAKQRFNKLMMSFSRNPAKREQYENFMNEYLALGHMKEVNDSPKECYFLPHHAVFKESSSTTKIRVVFDASAASSTGISLNDTQLVGPTVQSDLVTIILRFCIHQVVLTADIPKMYRQVQIHEDDRRFQRILWLNKKGEMSTFELSTVTYGCSSAPYLATRSLIQLASDESETFPLAAEVIRKDSYIDDFITGGKTIADVIEIYKQLNGILEKGGFGVHKFCSNSEEVLKMIPAELQEKQMDFEGSDINNTIKTLGLIWNPSEDYFVFNVPPLDSSIKPTKRIVLAEIGRLFDPLGFLGPVVTLAKLTMQELWRLKMDWEDELPQEQLEIWKSFRQQLCSVKNIRKQRCVIPVKVKSVELHGYCDASKVAYGACLYVRSVSENEEIEVRLICSKSRVAPLKPMTIPRLELCGALLLAQLTKKVKEALNIKFDSITLWSDSQIVLSWLKKSPLTLNEFVCNRVATIVEFTHDYEWRYVRSQCNPADSLSRGELPEQLLENEQWWTGPVALHKMESIEEPTFEILAIESLPEIRKVKHTLIMAPKQQPFDLSRLSNFNRLNRAWGYVLRFIANKCTKTRNYEPLTAEELSRASRIICRLVQNQAFGDLKKDLSSGSMKRTNYSSLAPFIDEDGLIRVGGRLKYSDIPYDGKHQILMPEKHPITEMIVRHLHEKHFHVGHSGLLSFVRQSFWPIKAKSVIKKVIGRCYRCFKCKPPQLQQYMGNLPSYRVTPAPPFSRTGVDFAGPFVLREGGRKPKYYNSYVAVFVCMTTKALHFELVTDMRTETFIAALQRFNGRRGFPCDMYSDNGTTFVGANHELAALRKLFEDQLHQRKLKDYCSSEGVTWHFIPPRSPHFGGIWEAGVKSMKYLMKRVVGETRLTYEEMYTFLVQAEAILNSRPLSPYSDNPNDFCALTPSHFLTGRSSKALPEPSYDDLKVGRLSRWQHIQMMRDHFWKKWSADYLHTLQTRQKWKGRVLEIHEGALVLLRDENSPPQQWKLGRIISTHPGKDGIVRVVTVRTAKGEYQRAVTKVCLLPDVDSDDSTGGV